MASLERLEADRPGAPPLRWRRCLPGELDGVVERLASWPADVGGAVRHMFPLSAIESFGADPVRVVDDGDRWAAAVVFPGRLLVPCGDATAIAEAGVPVRRWRLLVGDAAAADAMLDRAGDADARVHVQRFLTVDDDAVPTAATVPDPGMRRAEPADLPRLADLAVQLHIDDRFGPHPGRAGARGYRQRLEQTVRQGLVYCVGPIGAPVAKLERSVSSRRWGVQLAGIVVSPEARGQGIGLGLVAAAVRAAAGGHARPPPPVSLHVRADNDRALGVYAAAGFRDREEWRLAVKP